MPLWSYSEMFIIPLNVTVRIENHIFGSPGDNLLILTVTCSLLKEKKNYCKFSWCADHTSKDISVKKSFVFSHATLKWLWDVIVFCSTPKQTVNSVGNWLKIGFLLLPLITRSLTRSSRQRIQEAVATKISDRGCYFVMLIKHKSVQEHEWYSEGKMTNESFNL